MKLLNIFRYHIYKKKISTIIFSTIKALYALFIQKWVRFSLILTDFDLASKHKLYTSELRVSISSSLRRPQYYNNSECTRNESVPVLWRFIKRNRTRRYIT